MAGWVYGTVCYHTLVPDSDPTINKPLTPPDQNAFQMIKASVLEATSKKDSFL